ncbi:MAG TPA: O-antigen ligase family protein [Thermoanaerobaculia bacterium]|nr:O-antigen ligase family protein [Thermoanaerobaculia bacterium]
MADEVESGLGVTGGLTTPALPALPAVSAVTSPGAAAGVAADAGDADGRWRRYAVAGYALHLFTVFALALSNILLGLTLALAPRALAGRRVRWAVLQPVLLPMGFYLVFLTASILLSYDVRTSLFSFGETFAMATLYLGPGLVRGERELRRLIDGMIAVAALLALRGLSQYLWLSFGELDQRIRGPFSHYMTFSGVLLICDVLLVTQMVCGRAAARSAWRWVALALINAALVGTMTRGAWVALGGTLLCLLAIAARRGRSAEPGAAGAAGAVGSQGRAGLPPHRASRFAAICALALLAVFLAAPASVLHRAGSIFDLRDPSNYDRLCMIDAGLHMIAERPFVGLGPDMVDHRYEIYRHPTAPRYWVPHLHNSFLEIAAERGLPSLAAYLWMMIAGIRLALRRYRAEGGPSGPRAELYLGSVLALLAFNLAGLFENNWGDAEVKRLALFALMIPFCLALADTEDAAGQGSHAASP